MVLPSTSSCASVSSWFQTKVVRRQASGAVFSRNRVSIRLSFQLNGQELGTWGSYMMAGIGGD